MVLIGFVGEMRSGKTLFMTIALYEDWLDKKQILTNYSLNIPYNELTVDMIEDSIKYDESDLFTDKSIGIDEIHLWMDARTGSAKRNRLLSYFITQSGKLDTKIYWTSQFLRQVDVRLRANTSILYKTSRYILKNGQKIYLSQNDKRTDFYIDADKYILKETPRGMRWVYEKTLTLKNAKSYFKLYDTKQKIIYTDLRGNEGDKR